MKTAKLVPSAVTREGDIVIHSSPRELQPMLLADGKLTLAPVVTNYFLTLFNIFFQCRWLRT